MLSIEISTERTSVARPYPKYCHTYKWTVHCLWAINVILRRPKALLYCPQLWRCPASLTETYTADCPYNQSEILEARWFFLLFRLMQRYTNRYIISNKNLPNLKITQNLNSKP